MAPSEISSVDDAVEAIGLGRFQWRLLGVNGLVWAGDAMEVIGIGFIIPSIIATFGVAGGQAGLIGSLFFAGMLFGAWGFGSLADRIGRRRVFLLTIALNAVFALASAFAPSFSVLLVFRFLNGLAVGGTSPVDYAVMADYLPKRERGGFWFTSRVFGRSARCWWRLSPGRLFRSCRKPAGAGFWRSTRCPVFWASGCGSASRSRQGFCFSEVTSKGERRTEACRQGQPGRPGFNAARGNPPCAAPQHHSRPFRPGTPLSDAHALYAATPEFYPTEVRATGTGVMGAAARAGGIVAAQLGGTLLLVSFPLALSIFALSLIVAGLAALFLVGERHAQALSERLGESV